MPYAFVYWVARPFYFDDVYSPEKRWAIEDYCLNDWFV